MNIERVHFTSFTFVITTPRVHSPYRKGTFRFRPLFLKRSTQRPLFLKYSLSLSLLITRSRRERKRLTYIYTHTHTHTHTHKGRHKQCRRRRLVNTSIDEAKSNLQPLGKKIIRPRRIRKTRPTTTRTTSSKPPVRRKTTTTGATNLTSRSIPIPTPRKRTKKSSTTT